MCVCVHCGGQSTFWSSDRCLTIWCLYDFGISQLSFLLSFLTCKMGISNVHLSCWEDYKIIQLSLSLGPSIEHTEGGQYKCAE